MYCRKKLIGDSDKFDVSAPHTITIWNLKEIKERGHN